MCEVNMSEDRNFPKLDGVEFLLFLIMLSCFQSCSHLGHIRQAVAPDAPATAEQ